MPQQIAYSDLRRGIALEIEGQPFEVMEWKHVVMQQRTPVLTLKLRHLKSGKTYERNVPGNQRLTLADVQEREAQYLFFDGQDYVFMDTESYEQFPLEAHQLGDQTAYLKEGINVEILSYHGEPVSIQLPTSVELVVSETPPAFKGDTAQGGRKPATLETGLSVRVPMHVSVGQIVKVDTRSGEYIELVT